MFKPELWQSHDEYRTIITTIVRRLSRNNPNPDKPEKILQFLHISSTIKKNVGGCVHVTYR